VIKVPNVNPSLLEQNLNPGQQWFEPFSRFAWLAFGLLFAVSLVMALKNYSSIRKGKKYYLFSMYAFILMSVESLLFLVYGLLLTRFCDFFLSHESFTRIFFFSFTFITTALILLCFVFVFLYLRDLTRACRDANMTLWQSFFKEP
jgi:hypothetical protein